MGIRPRSADRVDVLHGHCQKRLNRQYILFHKSGNNFTKGNSEILCGWYLYLIFKTYNPLDNENNILQSLLHLKLFLVVLGDHLKLFGMSTLIFHLILVGSIVMFCVTSHKFLLLIFQFYKIFRFLSVL